MTANPFPFCGALDVKLNFFYINQFFQYTPPGRPRRSAILPRYLHIRYIFQDRLHICHLRRLHRSGIQEGRAHKRCTHLWSSLPWNSPPYLGFLFFPRLRSKTSANIKELKQDCQQLFLKSLKNYSMNQKPTPRAWERLALRARANLRPHSGPFARHTWRLFDSPNDPLGSFWGPGFQKLELKRNRFEIGVGESICEVFGFAKN